jgi:hypothetical protein
MTEDSEIVVTALRQNPPAANERVLLGRRRPALWWMTTDDGWPGGDSPGTDFNNFIGARDPETLAA